MQTTPHDAARHASRYARSLSLARSPLSLSPSLNPIPVSISVPVLVSLVSFVSTYDNDVIVAHSPPLRSASARLNQSISASCLTSASVSCLISLSRSLVSQPHSHSHSHPHTAVMTNLCVHRWRRRLYALGHNYWVVWWHGRGWWCNPSVM